MEKERHVETWPGNESLTIENTFGEEEMGRETGWASKGARGKG